MLDLTRIDVQEIATALADQTDYDHRWLIDSRTGEVAFWTSDTGIDGENAVEIDELDLVPIDPLPSYVWYQDMVDFAEGITDDAARLRFARVLQGKGAFRRFKNLLYEHHPELISAWHALYDVEPSDVPSNGCWTSNSSMMAPPRRSRPVTQIPICPDPNTCDDGPPVQRQAASYRRLSAPPVPPDLPKPDRASRLPRALHSDQATAGARTVAHQVSNVVSPRPPPAGGYTPAACA